MVSRTVKAASGKPAVSSHTGDSSLGSPTTSEEVLQLPLLFRGRRVLVVDNRVHRSFGEDDDIVCWDRVLLCDFCSAVVKPDGSFEGSVAYGMHALPVSGATARDLAREALGLLKWTLDN